MKRTIIAAIALALFAGVGEVSAQNETPEIPIEKRAKKLPRQKLSGPRFGFTTFTGETATHRADAGMGAMMSQFGWQFETQIVSLESGNQALIEVVPLVGGIESGEYNLSLSGLVGYRLEGGIELGVGPTVSYNPTHEITTSSIQVVLGLGIPMGEFLVPVNLAMGISDGEMRLTLLAGWIIG